MAYPLYKSFLASLASLLFCCTALDAQVPARFDLAGPKVEIRVTRDGVTLPIAQVPNLKAGDRLWLHPDFPATQSVRYLLVAAFLRGTTNPPPDSWFTRIDTWTRAVQTEGVFITVPEEAQQAILFLAPETGGDFSTLRSAVKGRPGIFVRASQDLNEAGFEQARIEKYLDGMRAVDPGDPKALSAHSTLLARTLALKPNDACFKQPVDAQYNCLTQTGNQLLLDDGHGQTIAAALSNGPTSDFINQASYTQAVGGGLYSAYVGAIVDLIRITASLHTAQYQYIPAIAFPDQQSLNLRLNAPPSFHNPKSVIVIGLPAIQAATPPPLRAADPRQIACLLRPNLVLGLDGAPLVFSTGFAHRLVLHVNSAEQVPDIPLTPDAFRGGLVVAPKAERAILPLSQQKTGVEERKSEDDKDIVTTPVDKGVSRPKATISAPSAAEIAAANKTSPTGITGTVSGMWGFDSFSGPTVPLQTVPGKGWKLVTTDPLIVGEDNHLTIDSSGTACIEAIVSDSVPGVETRLDWKPADKVEQIALTLPLKSLKSDSVQIAIKQYGDRALDIVTARTYSEPARLDSLSLHAGDTTAVLIGTSLDQVRQVEMRGLIFIPSATQESVSHDGERSRISLSLDPKASDPKSSGSKLAAGDRFTATASLKDGRTLTLPVTVDMPRPVVALLSKGIDQAKASPIHLSPDELPLNEKLTFFLKSPDNYPRNEQIEIASTDDSLHTRLDIADGTLILQNKHTVFATFEPLKSFGTSAFGPLRLRAIAPDGTAGDWIPLATLVRVPTLTDLHCPVHSRQQPCTLEGSDLYLVDSFSTDEAFGAPIPVPEGFVGDSIAIPHPVDTVFYVRLRDDPTITDQVTMPITPPAQTSQPAPSNSSSSPAGIQTAAPQPVPPTKQ